MCIRNSIFTMKQVHILKRIYTQVNVYIYCDTIINECSEKCNTINLVYIKYNITELR